MNAERAFSAMSQSRGVADAFLANAADSGLVFTPAPTRAREQYAGRPNPPILLTWYPVAAKISAAGDLGYTTGPFELKPRTAGPPPATATTPACGSGSRTGAGSSWPTWGSGIRGPPGRPRA